MWGHDITKGNKMMDRRSVARLVCALSMGMAGLAYGQQQGTVTYVYTEPLGTP